MLGFALPKSNHDLSPLLPTQLLIQAQAVQARCVDVFPLREEVPATRMMTSALWLKGRLVVPRFAPGDQLAGLFEEHAQVRRAWTLSLMQIIQGCSCAPGPCSVYSN